MIKVTKPDPFTGEDNTYELDITEDQFNRWQAGEHIQKVMPNLSADEREFLISGVPIGKFDEIFEEDEDEDEGRDYDYFLQVERERDERTPTFQEHEIEKYLNGDMRDEDEDEGEDKFPEY